MKGWGLDFVKEKFLSIYLLLKFALQRSVVWVNSKVKAHSSWILSKLVIGDNFQFITYKDFGSEGSVLNFLKLDVEVSCLAKIKGRGSFGGWKAN